jgi:hypothetical protein
MPPHSKPAKAYSSSLERLVTPAKFWKDIMLYGLCYV